MAKAGKTVLGEIAHACADLWRDTVQSPTDQPDYFKRLARETHALKQLEAVARLQYHEMLGYYRFGDRRPKSPNCSINPRKSYAFMTSHPFANHLG